MSLKLHKVSFTLTKHSNERISILENYSTTNESFINHEYTHTTLHNTQIHIKVTQKILQMKTQTYTQIHTIIYYLFLTLKFSN